MDELCISKRRNLWLWTAVSRYTGQILAWLVGSREWHHLERLWRMVPEPWRKRLVYSDGYGAYSAFFSSWQHRPCEKGDGGTATVEGVNTSLRHRCGPLVRRACGRRQDNGWLANRIGCAVVAHNRGGQRRLNRRFRDAQKRRNQRAQSTGAINGSETIIQAAGARVARFRIEAPATSAGALTLRAYLTCSEEAVAAAPAELVFGSASGPKVCP